MNTKKSPVNSVLGISRFKRRRFFRSFLKNSSLGVLTIISIFTLGLIMKVPLKTTDDSVILPYILEKVMSKNILGASTENQDYLFGCTEQKPVIGWIDYSGNKIIAESLPDNEKASACFANLKEAQKEGFNLKNSK